MPEPVACLQRLLQTPPWEWPAQARDVISAALSGSEAPLSRRLIAAQLAGELMITSDRLVALLLAVLLDAAEPPALRAVAATALGPVLEQLDMGMADIIGAEDDAPISPERLDDIRAALSTVYFNQELPDFVRGAALHSSLQHPEDWHQHAILAAYYSNEPRWQLTALDCMHHLPGFEDLILEALDSDDPALQAGALRAAGARGLQAAWPRVVELLTAATAPPLVIRAAVAAATGIRRRDAPVFLDSLLESGDTTVAERIRQALGLAGGEELADDDDDDCEHQDSGEEGWRCPCE